MNQNYYKRTSEDIINAVALFCRYHNLLREYAKRGLIKSSVDRGTFVRPQDILPNEILDLLGRKSTSHSYAYGSEAGDYKLRKKISEVENLRHGTSYSAENIAIMPGAWAGLEFALQELINLGNGKMESKKVAVIGPTLYQMFHYPIKSLGVDVTAYDFVNPNLEHIPTSMTDLDEVFKDKPKAIIITNPNNPDGKYFPNDLLEQVVKRAEDEKVYIIVDELQNFFPQVGMQDLRYDPWIQSPNIIRVDSPSKRHAIPEYRVGWIIAEPELLGDRMEGLVGRMSGIMGNAPRAANTALIYLLDKEINKLKTSEDFFAENWKELLEKENYVLGRLSKMPNIKAIFPRDACINIAIQVNYSKTDLELAEDLMKQGTLIMPASGYGYNSTDAVLRITFAERPEKLKHSLDTLESVLGN